jgi:hypothetical protein
MTEIVSGYGDYLSKGPGSIQAQSLAQPVQVATVEAQRMCLGCPVVIMAGAKKHRATVMAMALVVLEADNARP